MRSTNIAAVGTARRGGPRRLAPLLALLLVVVVCSFLLWYTVISDETVRPGFGTNQQFFHRSVNQSSAVCATFDGLQPLGDMDVPMVEPQNGWARPTQQFNKPIVFFQAYGWGNPRTTHLYEDFIFFPQGKQYQGYRSYSGELFYMAPEEQARLPPTSPLLPLLETLDVQQDTDGVNFGLIDGRRSLLTPAALPLDIEGKDQHHTLNPYAKALHQGLLDSFEKYGAGLPLAHLCQAWTAAKGEKRGQATVAVAHVSNSLVLTVAGIGNVGVHVFRPAGSTIAWSMPEQWHNQFVPFTLGPDGDGLDDAEVYSAQLQANDIVIMVTDGVSDNMEKAGLVDVITSNKLQGPKAEQLVKVAELVGLGLSMTPFSKKAMEAGVLIQGGRQDDSSAILLQVGVAQDLFARRAAAQAQSQAQMRATAGQQQQQQGGGQAQPSGTAVKGRQQW